MERAKARAGWILISPALLQSIFFIALPSVLVIGLSFMDIRLVGETEFIAFENYAELFADDVFWQTVGNTLLYTVAVVPIAMAISLLIALGLNQQLRARGFFRTLFYVPVVTSTVAISLVWLWIYNPSEGLANEILAFFGLAKSGWLTDPNMAMWAIIIVGVWQGLGIKMVLYLGALQGVSQDLLEAAKLDGASRWQTFWNVTWPGIAPVQVFVVITSIAGSFQAFDLVYIMTRGGPVNSTRVLAFDIYERAFGSFEFGLAAAETVIMLIIVAVFIFSARYMQRKSEE